MDYSNFTSRNFGFINSELQNKIKNCRLLFSGCGLGSTIAEAAVRLGFEKVILADPDTIETHNLNRQSYSYDQVTQLKVIALSSNLRKINPNVQIQVVNEGIQIENVESLVRSADVIIDTIDFQALPELLLLHDWAEKEHKPILGSIATGWGAIALYFDPDANFSLRKWLNLENESLPRDTKAADFLLPLFENFKKSLAPESFSVLMQAFQLMEDGRPCPAPQIAIGSLCSSALVMTMALQYLKGESLPAAPEWKAFDLSNLPSVSPNV